jgi:hypothetical protein
MKKEKMFELFDFGVKCANNLGLHNENKYLCPLCRKPFTKEDIQNGKLTIEHVPQDKIGGHELVLTCKYCNTERFSSIDNNLIQYHKKLDIMSALKGEKEIKNQVIQLESNSIKVNALSSIGSNYFDIFPDEKHNNLSNLKKFDSIIEKENLNINIRTKIKYSERLSQIAELKNAYLFSFTQFGYSYIFEEKHEIIFNQLLYPLEQIINGFYFDKTENEDNMKGIYIIKKPFKFIFVYMEKCKIALPWFQDAQNLYTFLNNHYRDNSILNCEIENDVPLPDKMMMSLDIK